MDPGGRWLLDWPLYLLRPTHSTCPGVTGVERYCLGSGLEGQDQAWLADAVNAHLNDWRRLRGEGPVALPGASGAAYTEWAVDAATRREQADVHASDAAMPHAPDRFQCSTDSDAMLRDAGGLLDVDSSSS